VAGVEPRSNSAAEFGELIQREIVVWQRVVKDAGIPTE
jgi:hypothetical protein